MPLLDELINHFRGEAHRLADTPFGAEVAADLRSLEGIVARRAQVAQAAFHQAETEVADWLRTRLHAGSATAESAPVAVPAEPAPADPAATQLATAAAAAAQQAGAAQ